MLPIAHALNFADPHLGRLDYDSLSDQALMEMLIDGIKSRSKEAFLDEKSNFKDVSDWIGIECIDDRVTKINLSASKFTEKQFPFEFIPALVRSFGISNCDAHGTLDTAVLPRHIEFFDVSENKLHGSINFAGFPQSIESIFLYLNNFSGSCALGDLPDTLVTLDANNNEFSGELSLNEMPKAMEYLTLSKNKISGSFSIEKLPSRMEVLDLQSNALSGDVRLLGELPRTLHKIDVVNNKEMGSKAVLSKAAPPMHFKLKSDRLEYVVDEEGQAHAWQEPIRRSSWRK